MLAGSIAEEADHERTRRFRSRIDVAGESVGFELYEIDTRSDDQRSVDAARHALAGDLIVIIPGHGQTADTTVTLLRTSAAASRAGVGWALDIDPPEGGDPVKAKALPLIVREHASSLFSPNGRDRPQPAESGLGVALFGWSHGGAEALRTAAYDPALIASVTGLCPTGLTERGGPELVFRFMVECLRIILAAIGKGPAALRQVLAIGWHIMRGITGDAIRTRSLRRPLRDAAWATRKVPGPTYPYSRQVALIFAAGDSVIRWQDVFPDCASSDDVAVRLDAYRRADFPCVSGLDVMVLPGNHASPEVDPTYALSALEMIGQSRANRGYD